MCNNISCGDHGSIIFNPPEVLPLKKFDNTYSNPIKCPGCGSNAFDVKHEYHDTVSVQIVDIEKTDNYNALDAMLYDEASRNIIAGEVIIVAGDIHMSYVVRSDDAISVSKSMNFDCYYCDYKTNIDKEYERHVIIKHPNKLCYPSEADLEKLGIAAKGKNWEI